MKRLPKTFQGARVVRGLGMDSDDVDDLLERKALSEFVASKPIYIVIADRDLDPTDAFGPQAFTDEKAALQYARACGNGNCDQRVLKVTEQTLVVATENEL